jgi:hypothetical protein
MLLQRIFIVETYLRKETYEKVVRNLGRVSRCFGFFEIKHVWDLKQVISGTYTAVTYGNLYHILYKLYYNSKAVKLAFRLCLVFQLNSQY